MQTQSPFRLSEMIAKAWVLYRHTLKQCFWIALIYSVINQLLSLQIIKHLQTQGSQLVVHNPLGLVGFLVLTIALLITTTAVIMLKQNNALFNVKASLKQQLSQQLPVLFIASVLFYILIMIGYLLYILPGILLATCFYFYFPVLLFSDRKLTQAFQYSFQLMKPHFWGVLGLVIFNFAIITVPVGIISITFSHFISGDLFGLKEAFTILVQAILLPLIACTTLTSYHHLKKYHQA